MPNFEPTLFTSIPPRMRRFVQGRDFGTSWQMACIASWKAAGFRTLSLNSPEEIEALRSFASIIEFEEIPEGQNRPSMTDFFIAASKSGSKIAGIVNADCMIIPQTRIAERLKDSINGIVIAERLNLSQETFRPTGVPCQGFDAFFFEVAALSRIERDDHWRIGEVWADFWLPLAFNAAGFEIKTLPAPILLHLNHELAWDWADWKSHFSRIIELLRAHGGGRLDSDLVKKLLEASELNDDDVDELSKLLFAWLIKREPLWCPEAGSLDDLITSILKAMATSESSVHPYRAQLKQTIDALGLRPTLYKLGLVKRDIPT